MTKVSSVRGENNGTTSSANKSKSTKHSSKDKSRHKVLDQERAAEEEDIVTIENPVYGTLSSVNIQDYPPMPAEKKKSPASSGHGSERRANGEHDEEEWMEMEGMKENKESSKKSKGKRRSRADDSDVQTMNLYHSNGSNGSLNNDNHRNVYGHSSSYGTSPEQCLDHELDDPGPHREMAIDVPDNFIASIKSPPRYPPPSNASKNNNTSPMKSNKGNISHSQNSIDSHESGNKTKKPYKPSQEELGRLQRHQEELKKRREEESRLVAEEDFLRTSLRGSKKLQALENRRYQQMLHPGFVNTAYDSNEYKDLNDEQYLDLDESDGKSRGQGGDVYLKKNIVLNDVLASFQHVKSKLTNPEDQKYLSFLKTYFNNQQFKNAVGQHHKIVEIALSSPPLQPVSEEAGKESSDLCYQAIHMPHDPYAQELLSILSEPKVKNLLLAHDDVAQQSLLPLEDIEMPGEPLDLPLMQYGEDSVKIVRIQKTDEHLGATVKNEGDSVIIGRIVKGGAAEKSGLLHEGDEILEVNGIDMRGRNINDVSEMLANMNGVITFMVIPNHMSSSEIPRSNAVMHLRALFSYDPEDDQYIPCKELGIGFMRGEILHAIALDDPNWWQAFREGEEEEALAGLIPSKSFTEQREAMKAAMENKENKRKGKVCACGKKERKKRKKKRALYSGVNDEADEILTYEEIARYYPQPNRKRPIVLIGPSNVGRQELQERLLDSDPDRFGAPVPHTTRSMRLGEVEGSRYHFVSRDNFQRMISQSKFLEYGELHKNLYGTSLDAVRSVVFQGKVCLLKLQPQSLRVVRASDLKPYIVFVRPPNLEKLRQLQDQLDKANAPIDQDSRGRVLLNSDDQLTDIIDCAREIEDIYGHLFDFVLVNSDLDRAYAELLEEINRIEVEPQWVPSVWVESL